MRSLKQFQTSTLNKFKYFRPKQIFRGKTTLAEYFWDIYKFDKKLRRIFLVF